MSAGRGKEPAPTGAKSAMNAFKSLDKAANPDGQGATAPKHNLAAGGKGGVTRNPSAIKQLMIQWCAEQTKDYAGVNVTNFGSSWADGLAFCALIHHFFPESFDFSTLDPKNRRENFTLAFETAEKMADIAPLLDVEDMVKMKVPDWKCVFCYVQSFYRRFKLDPRYNKPEAAKPAPEPEEDQPNPFKTDE